MTGLFRSSVSTHATIAPALLHSNLNSHSIMAISGPSGYVPTTTQFITLWALANVHPGAGGGVVLAGGIAQPYLVSLLGALTASRDHVTDMGVDRSLAREALRALVIRLHDRLLEF